MKIKRILFLLTGAFIFCAATSLAQPVFTVQNKKDACDGLANGSFEVLVSSANTPPLRVFVFGPPDIGPINATVGVPVPITGLPGTVGGKTYLVIVQDADGSTPFLVTIFSISSGLSASLNAAVDNSSCFTPNGSIDINASGGTLSYTYAWTGPNGFTASTQDISGLAGGTYNVTVFDNGTNCFRTLAPITITDPSPAVQNVTTASPLIVCIGSNAQISLNTTEAAPVSYEVVINGVPSGISQTGTGGPISLTIPSGSFANGDVLAVRAVNGSCTPVNMNGVVIVNIAPLPTAVTSGGGTVCASDPLPSVTFTFTGTPPFNFTYFDGVTSFPIVGHNALTFTIPNAPAGTYSVTSLQDNNGCTATSFGGSVQVIVNPNPTITLGANPSVCFGSTTANLTYSATTGSPNQYSIDFNAAANLAGFADVVSAVLPASPIVITVPGAAPVATYNATFTVTNSLTGCSSSSAPITVTVNSIPTITLGANPTVCSGTTSANLTYSATTSSPNQYSIDFNAAANLAGFADVVGSVLPASPIVITVPGAAAAATYNATLTVTNSATGCVSSATPISVTVIPAPTITLGVNPSVCSGTTSANLTYSATSGGANQFSIDFDAAANLAGFADVGATALPASPIVITVPGAAAVATYNATFTIINSVTGCSSSTPITVTINSVPTITLGANPSVCSGTTSANLTYSATTGSPNQYSIDFNAAANLAGFADVVGAALPASPIIITVPGAAAAATYNATLTVTNSITGCGSSSTPITITINPSPTITLGANPSVCAGTTSANLTYSATSGSPNQFSIDFNAAANLAGFADVGATALPASPIVITIPGAAAAATYNATFTIINSVTGCSSSTPITVTINPIPTITLGANPSVCAGTTTANLTYSATTGSPNQFSIDFDAAANLAGFADVVASGLTASPIVITVPGAAPVATYNATLTVTNSVTGCGSSSTPITVTINSIPTITLGANPSVCAGTTSANLTYSATTGSPDQFSIDFNAAANLAGFVDVGATALPASPVVITVPGAAAAATYNATFTIINSVTGCSSSTPIAVTINPSPTITLGANPSVCAGTTSANLTYSATTGSPNQFSIDFDAAANLAGFADVVATALPASPIVITVPGAAAVATYNATFTIINSVTGCSSSTPITVTINSVPTITLGANPSVCAGTTTANLTYSATTGSPNQFSIDFDAAANLAGFADVAGSALPASPIVITVPGAAAAATYNATLTVTNSITGCGSTSTPITVTVNPSPSITLGANPSVCEGTTSANLTYSATAGSPDQFSIDFNAAANLAGFVDVGATALPASPIIIIIPGAAAAATYNATFTIINSITGCSSSTPITVTINSIPTITLGANPSVCSGTTSANLTYSATTGSPNQFSVDFDAAANLAGFADVVGSALPASPIVITVPGAAAPAIYNAILTVTNTITGCGSSSSPITVTINPSPTITLGANPSVCAGTTSANLTYSATTGSPDQFSIDFDAAANLAGFADVGATALPASPIVITVPGAAAAATYNASLTIINSVTGCSSSTPITVTINPGPTITLGTNPSVCSGTTSANLTYSATTGSPDQFSIDFDAAANLAGFADVGATALPASPIVITIPGAAAAATYNASLTIINSVTGCSSSTPITVTISPSPTITLGANPSVCSGTTSATLTYSATTGGPNQFSIDFDAAANLAGFADVGVTALPASPIVITVPGAAAAATYNATLTIINSVTGCSSSMPITITINSTPDSTINPAGPFCTNTLPVTLSAVTPGGTWSGVGITDAVLGTFDPAVAGAGSKIITYTITSGGCTAFSTTTINVFTAPDATITPAGPFCTTDAAANLTGATAGGIWSGTGITDVVLGTFNPAVAGAGTHTITYSVTIGICSDSKTLDITVATPPDATITPAGPFCSADAAVTLVAATAGGVWSGTGITDTALGTFDPGTAGAGTFTITYSITIGGCSDSKTTDITVNPSPDATITAAGPFCTTDAAVNLTAATAGGVWSGTGITDTALGTFNPATAGAGTFTITYSIAGICPDSETIDITVATPPDATITPAGPFCSADAAVTLAAVTAGGVWSGTGITDTALGTFDPGTAGAGTFTITYSITIGGCSDSKTTDITVNPSPDATITAAGPFCITDAAVNLTAATAGGVWSGTGITDTALGTFDPTTAGVGTFTITYSIAGICPDSKTIDITVANPPDATITPAGPFCSADAAVTLAAVTAGGVWSGTGITDTALGTFDPGTAGAGTFTITYSITIGGCSDSKTTDITVNPSPDATITAAGPFCLTDAAVNLTAATAGGVWSGTGITDTALGTFDPTTAGAGTFTITYSIAGICPDSKTIDITVAPPPNATITPAGPFCSADPSVTLVAATAGGVWSGTGITDTALGTFDPATAGVGTFTITYSVTIGGCNDSQTTDITVDPSATATINAAGPFCLTSAATNLTATVAGGTWSGTGITNAALGTFDPALAGVGSHLISYTISGSCGSIATRTIVVNATCGGPNCFAFTITVVAAQTTRPTCSGKDDGVITLDIAGTTPGSYIIQLLTPTDTLTQVAPSGIYTYPNLSAGNYQYRIEDAIGNVCQQPYSLPLQTTVTASANSFGDATCFGQPTGTAVINASGSGTGFYFYSVDNGVNWTLFTPGNPVSNLPPNGTYNILVGESINDACNATVSVTIDNANPDLQIGTTITDATCNNNDGSILITPPVAPNIGGGGPYQYALSDGINTTAFQDGLTFDNLAGGVYSILVQDGINCIKTITPVNVTFPGFVNFTATPSPATCLNNGLSGSINVDITDIGGVYKVALSTDQFNEPAASEYLDYSEPSITFDNLANGTYFIYVLSQTATCPTRSAAINVNGVNAVNFDLVPQCNGTEVSLRLDNITGEVQFGQMQFEIHISDKRFPGTLVTPGGFPVTIQVDPNLKSITLDYNDPTYVFLTIPGIEYQIYLTQISVDFGCEVVSDVKDYTTTRPVFARAKPRLSKDDGESYDDIATGKMSIIDFDGGFIPYAISITLDSAKGSTSYPGDGILTEVELNNNLQFEKIYENIPAGRYIVHVEDSIGCVLEFYERVPLDIDLFVPNIITPNNDGLNDVFFIRNLPADEGKLTITDRWGAKVFSTNAYKNDWDAEDVSDGVYYYTLKTSSESKKGWIEVLKAVKP